MNQILALFIRNGGFITFLLLEAFCFFLIVNYNQDQRGIFSHTAGIVAGKALNQRRAATQYITAAGQVDSLHQVVARLRTELAARQFVRIPYRDTFFVKSTDSLENFRPIPQYRFVAGQVVSNSVSNRNNWFTINIGTADGIKPGMGVVLPRGIMGVVRECTHDFSICMSILHEQSKVSARLTDQKVLGSLQYAGSNPRILNLQDIPKHVTVERGDLVETSGFSTIFPGGIPIGTVDTVILPPGSNFYNIEVRLETDLSQAEYVYVVDYIYREAVDSLMQKVNAQ